MSTQLSFAVGHFPDRVEVVIMGQKSPVVARLFGTGEAERLVLTGLSALPDLCALGVPLASGLEGGATEVPGGNRGPSRALPTMSELRMQPRRHYRPSMQEIEASLLSAGLSEEPVENPWVPQ
ncbi:MAG: hypothetical protein QM713_06165 [Arachnia sp.]